MIIERWTFLSPRAKIWILILTPFFIALAGYFLFLYPRVHEIETLKREEGQLAAKLAEAQRITQQLQKFRQDLLDQEREFQAMLTILPEGREIPKLLHTISTKGAEEGIEFLIFKPEKEVQKDFYVEIPVSVKVKGNYRDLGAFLERIQNMDRLVTIRQLELGGFEEASRQMILQCLAMTYQFSEKKADAPPPKTPPQK